MWRDDKERAFSLTKAVFLDRDGVINQRPPEGLYVTRWADFHILPGVADAIALLNQASFSVAVVTNQRCVAKGLITEAELDDMHQRMIDSLAAAGATVDAVYYCPHEFEPPCECRKPAPGMLLTAARSHAINLGTSWMIGDSDIDIQAGSNAGCKTARLPGANSSVDSDGRPVAQCPADIVAPSLLEAVREILAREAVDAHPSMASAARTFSRISDKH